MLAVWVGASDALAGVTQDTSYALQSSMVTCHGKDNRVTKVPVERLIREVGSESWLQRIYQAGHDIMCLMAQEFL